MEGTTIILLSCTMIFTMSVISTAMDSIRPNQTLRDGNTIVSTGGEFELGFFSPINSSTNRYLGIWYKRISSGTVVWVANRETPLTNTYGVLKVDSTAIILLGNDSSNSIIWSSNLSRVLKNPVAQLLDTGNLVFRDENDGNTQNENLVWQSFDYPGDNMLPGMKFGVDIVTGLERSYTSWRSSDDPSPGDFTSRLDPHGYPQLLVWKGSALQSRNGPWAGTQFSGNPSSKPNGIYNNKFVMNAKEIYYTFNLVNRSSMSAVTRLLFTPNGDSKRLMWIDQNQEWAVYVTFQATDCDRYGLCGAFSTCNINHAPRCECLKGFDPKFPKKWEAADQTDGCVRRTPLNCGDDGFIKHSDVKLPDTRRSSYNMSMNLNECQKMCLSKCSCTAYANVGTAEGGNACLLWFDELMDMKENTEDAQDIYVRTAASELEENRRSRVKRRMLIIVIPAGLTLLLASVLLYLLKKRKMKIEGRLTFCSESAVINKKKREDFDLPLYGFTIIANATNDFSERNTLGEGGFGLVYKGVLKDGREIAVKRLSQDSCQGINEFKNEVSCIAKLQHRNLVTLLGCCIEKGERILVYEYMPNKSLDSVIFDEEIRKLLDWAKCYNIIIGIARGLLYLHRDSKLRIIHRDIKASNILLDHDMNPKISDFGMARSFNGSETEGNTTRVVGTYGYMSPEYAIEGQFSTKSDVYSFGVLLIEIVSGMKNSRFDHPDHDHNLLGHAWKSFNEGKLVEVIERSMLEASNQKEICRVIQIGLLCVQLDPQDRPNMSSVVLMLNSKNNALIQQPKQPGFFSERKLVDTALMKRPMSCNSNKFTVTAVVPR